MHQSKALGRSFYVAALALWSTSAHAEAVLPPAILLVPVSVLIALAWGAASGVEAARSAVKILRLSYIIDLSICALAMGFSASSIYGGLKESSLVVGICLAASIASYGAGWIFGKVARYATIRSKNTVSKV